MAWSSSWKGSVKPGKQRMYVRIAPLHIKRGFLAAHLSKELRTKQKIRSMPLRTGDKVIVLRGQFRKKTGKVESVDLRRTKVYITGIESTKKDGSKASYPLHPSNLMITELDTSDKRRLSKPEKKS